VFTIAGNHLRDNIFFFLSISILLYDLSNANEINFMNQKLFSSSSPGSIKTPYQPLPTMVRFYNLSTPTTSQP